MHLQTRIAAPDARLAPLAGLAGGTLVLTLRGEVAVDDLLPGDRIITRDAGAQTLRAVESLAARVAPVRIVAGTLGHNRPGRDLVVGPGTLIHLRDWRARVLHGAARAVAEAARLADGEFVVQERPRGLTLHRPLLDGPHVLYADGVELVV
ncbi:Hint domain-containing protein [Rubellimicrobium sp. CFH 75288]|uniref:Hint domain-containing protein n=1 Tax=Rubellimicrobium sp. CFH 75288 TaxID=2697034 RepID=UPI0014120633|nr:Hint domain-containing protein [Rubellimicrobium sp. CFH 75288]NAZ35545.1 hypothetical protein [Rubellimicrobium sp. CFH 75288]